MIKMGIESEKLLSLKLISEATGKKNIVWQWENKKVASEIQEEAYEFSNCMPVREMLSVPFINDLGEEETYYVAIRSVGNTLAEAMKLFVPVYIVGLMLTLGGIFIVVSKKRYWGG